MKKIFLITSILFGAIFVGCQTVTDCIIRIEPNLIEKTLKNGNISLNYNDNINLEMKGANTNDYFISTINIIGNLPKGISYYQNGNSINFGGIPTEVATTEFEVSVTVRPYLNNSDGSDNLCGNSTSRKYKIIIN
jgi:hypothetical protein